MLTKITFKNEIYETRFKVKNKDSNTDKIKSVIYQFCDKIGAELRMISSMIAYEDKDGSLSNYKENDRENTTKIKVILNGKEEEEEIFINLYREGFVINLGKKAANIFGVVSEQYLEKITRGSKNIYLKTVTKPAAKVFKTISQAVNYLEKNEYELHRFVINSGYYLTYEFASKVTEEKFDKEKNKNHIQRIDEVLERINTSEDQTPEYIFGETPKEEAIIRMKELGIWDKVIDIFEKEDRAMISDVGGIFFDLDDEAKEIIDIVKNIGGLPYLVVKYGHMYSCLYVSKYKEEWDMERLNKKYGTIFSATTNGFPDGYDLGDIMVTTTVAGGLSRIG